MSFKHDPVNVKSFASLKAIQRWDRDAIPLLDDLMDQRNFLGIEIQNAWILLHLNFMETALWCFDGGGHIGQFADGLPIDARYNEVAQISIADRKGRLDDPGYDDDLFPPITIQIILILLIVDQVDGRP